MSKKIALAMAIIILNCSTGLSQTTSNLNENNINRSMSNLQTIDVTDKIDMEAYTTHQNDVTPLTDISDMADMTERMHQCVVSCQEKMANDPEMMKSLIRSIITNDKTARQVFKANPTLRTDIRNLVK